MLFKIPKGQIPDGWPRNQKELRKQLIELRKNWKPKRITIDEYENLQNQARFICPLNRDHRFCWVNKQKCAERKNPCDECPAYKRYELAGEEWGEDKITKEKLDEEWKLFLRKCNGTCIPAIKFEEEHTYYEECCRAIHASLILDAVYNGKIEILEFHEEEQEREKRKYGGTVIWS